MEPAYSYRYPRVDVSQSEEISVKNVSAVVGG